MINEREKLYEVGKKEYEKGNYSEAVTLFKKAANLGNVKAQYNLGHCYYMGIGVIKKFADAFYWFSKASLENHNEAQKKLGDCYLMGYGTEKNKQLAEDYYKMAIYNGNIEAIEILAAIQNKERENLIISFVNMDYMTLGLNISVLKKDKNILNYDIEKIKEGIKKSSFKE